MSEIITGFDLGNRYGQCILASNLNLLEKAHKSFSNKRMIPKFMDDHRNEQQRCFFWVGYLQTGYLSLRLCRTFNHSYKFILSKYDKLPAQAQEGLRYHLCAQVWLDLIDIKKLNIAFNYLEYSDKRKILNKWHLWLEEVENQKHEDFWKRWLSPIWDLLREEAVSNSIDFDDFLFWQLLPFSGSYFHTASSIALQRTPNNRTSSINVFEDFSSQDELISLNSEQLIKIIVVLLTICDNVLVNEKALLSLYNKLKRHQPSNLDTLRNKYAEKGIMCDQ